MENTEHYLYAITVEDRIWGELPVCAGNHYEIHAINKVKGKSEEDVVSSYIWELRCEKAEGCVGELQCTNCGEEEGNCECDEPDYEGMHEHCEVVENNSDALWEMYDPTNIDHILCPGAEKYRDTEERDAILLKQAQENKAREIGRINSKINSLEDELFKIKQQRTKLESEFKELK